MSTFEQLAVACTQSVDQGARARRSHLAAALRDWPGSVRDDAEESAWRQLGDGEAPVLVAGQQAGLAGGAALTLWKTLALTVAADRLEEQTGVRPVCVFWVEGNDHDWDEAATPGWPLKGWTAPRPAGAEERPVGRIELPESWWRGQAAQLESLLEAWPESERERMAGAWTGSLTRHTALLLRRLLPGSGILALDPSLPALREVAAPFALELQAREAGLVRALATDTERLRGAGLPTPVQVDERPPWFHEDEEGRRRRALPGARVPVERFSPGVLTRVLLQDWLLTPAASFLGPTELAYHAQAVAAGRLMGLPRTLRLPRPQVQLLSHVDGQAWPQDTVDPWSPPQPGQPWPEELLLALPGGGELHGRLARLAGAQAELLALCAGGRADLEQLGRRQEALGAQLRQALLEGHKAAHRAELKGLHERAAWQDGPAGAQERRVNALALLGRMGGSAVLPGLRRLLDPFAEGQQRFICDPSTGRVTRATAEGRD